jgi:hypothetical protein
LVLLDFSNAFDSDNHHLPCSKLLNQLGFTTSAVSLIMSFLSDRSQCVQTDGALSNYQIYISCEPHRIKNCMRNTNMDLDRIHQFIKNCLAINPENSQALLVNPSILPSPIVSLHLIAICRQSKNSGIIFNQEHTMIKFLGFAEVCILHKGGFGRFHISHQLKRDVYL